MEKKFLKARQCMNNGLNDKIRWFHGWRKKHSQTVQCEHYPHQSWHHMQGLPFQNWSNLLNCIHYHIIKPSEYFSVHQPPPLALGWSRNDSKRDSAWTMEIIQNQGIAWMEEEALSNCSMWTLPSSLLTPISSPLITCKDFLFKIGQICCTLCTTISSNITNTSLYTNHLLWYWDGEKVYQRKIVHEQWTKWQKRVISWMGEEAHSNWSMWTLPSSILTPTSSPLITWKDFLFNIGQICCTLCITITSNKTITSLYINNLHWHWNGAEMTQRERQYMNNGPNY